MKHYSSQHYLLKVKFIATLSIENINIGHNLHTIQSDTISLFIDGVNLFVLSKFFPFIDKTMDVHVIC